MSGPRPQISVFPKCYFDELYQGKRDYLDWLRQAATLGAEGVEHYDGFFRSPDEAGAAPVRRVLEVIGRIDSPFFGVQYDPSNATVGGYDPVAFLERVKHRVVSVHASDRYLAPGATPDDLRRADGTPGYSDKLRHGETGRGLNDYDAIFRILSGVGFAGWVSVEDSMNGLDELRRSVEFLKGKRAQYYPGAPG